jgi:hypothetical protein
MLQTPQLKNNYLHFLRAIEVLLSERHSNLLPRKANLFTTNYDLFVEGGGGVAANLDTQ